MSCNLIAGDPAPWFHAPALGGNSNYAFDIAAGRAIVLLFLGRANWESGAAALQLVKRHRNLFDDEKACFFGVSVDPNDANSGIIKQLIPGIRWFLDYDASVSRQYGAVQGDVASQRYRPFWMLLDRALRVVEWAPIKEGDKIFASLDRLITEEVESLAPVLSVSRIFEPDMCSRLIALYEQQGGEESGFMQDVSGITKGLINHSHKRRFDCRITEEPLRSELRARIHRVLLPLVERTFQFKVTRAERDIIACYDGDNGGGHFRPHRDNTTHGTAHRRFACTINLNSEDYDGGDLRFPEFGRRTYRAPTGGAVVFSCSLLHEATPVTRGKRYAYLPFFYDDAAADIREANTAHVSAELASYKANNS